MLQHNHQAHRALGLITVAPQLQNWHFSSTVSRGTPAKVCHLLVCACPCGASNALACEASVMQLTSDWYVAHAHYHTRIPRGGLPQNILPLAIAFGSIGYRFFHLGACNMKCMAPLAFLQATWCSQVHGIIGSISVGEHLDKMHVSSNVTRGTPAKVCHLHLCACPCGASNALAWEASVMRLTSDWYVAHAHYHTRIPRRGLPQNILPLAIASGSI